MTKKRSGRKYPSAPLSPFPHISACGSGCGSKLSHTLTHRSKRAKNKEKVLFSLENRTFCDCHGFCCPRTLRIPQGKGSARGKPLRVSPLVFSHPPAGDHFCAAKVQLQKKKTTQQGGFLLLELLGGFEPPTSSLPTAVEPSSPCCTRLFGGFLSKKDEVAACLFHCFHPRVSPCGSRCGSNHFQDANEGRTSDSGKPSRCALSRS